MQTGMDNKDSSTVSGIHQHYQEGSLRGNVILCNGRIHTMDATNQVVSVVAIRDGKIVYVGDDEESARNCFLHAPRTIDLKGNVTIPGLVDCHNHIVLFGNRPGHHTPLENSYSIADVQETYRERARNVPDGEFITTIGGFHPGQFFERRLPTLAELDEALPKHPAFVSFGFTGPAATNTLGKAFFAGVAVGADGSIAGGEENGKALLALRQQLTFDDRKRGVRDAMAYAVSLGVTTHLDQGAFPATNTPADGSGNEDNNTMHLPFLAVYNDGDATIRLRINFLTMDATADTPTLTARLQNAFRFFGNDMVRTGSMGEFVTLDYAGGPVFDVAIREVREAGWRLEVHSITPSDYMTQVEAFEKLDAELSIKGLRWVIAHVPFITDEFIGRLKKLECGVNLSSFQYLNTLNAISSPAGPPYRNIVDSGIHAGIGGDGMQIAMLNPWVQAYYATTGKNAQGVVVNPNQQISRQEILQLYTRANQWFLGKPDEDLLGALEVGRLGDVVVLNEDYFSVPDEELKKLRSVLTVVGGVVVHAAGEFS
ncbi:putative amidohydrolase family protein [Mycena venus]|uniref:Putative amidohydrolase family protein n=1 Tax=Mycena venus TaxID=2733690 RepID=A0A8H7CJU8_9AGAR|nr:putative amidohydrolase family protein [Mycena venus]